MIVNTTPASLQAIALQEKNSTFTAKFSENNRFEKAQNVDFKMASLSDIAAKYDIRNMSPRQMVDLSTELFQKGVISEQDHMTLSFQPELGNQKSSGVNFGDPDAPKDFVAQWESQLDFHRKSGDTQSAEISQRMLNILGNLDALRS